MSGNSWRKTALVMSVLAVCGSENRSSGDEGRTEYIYGDSIEEDHGGGPLGIRLGVPDSCDLTFDTGHSKLSEISLVDDDIQVANVDRAYTVSFDRMRMDTSRIQDMVESVFDKDQGIYCRDDGDENMTKEEIQKEIDLIEVYRQQALEEGQQDVAEIYESDIAETKNRMKEAPDSYTPVREYTTNKIYIGQHDGEQYSLWISGDDTADASGRVSIVYEPAGDQEQKYLADVEDAVMTETAGQNYFGGDIEDQENKCGIDENTAEHEAQAFLDRMGISGMAKCGSQAVVRSWLDSGFEIIKAEKNGYMFEFGIQIGGVDTAYIDPTGVDNLKNKNGYVMYEGDRIFVCVDDSGVFNVRATLSTDTDSFVREKVDLLSWEDMVNKADESIVEYYEKYPTAYSEVRFNNVEFMYVPCIQDGEKLVYIPAWVLTQSENNDISEEHGAYDNIVQLVYINAVDGSCVDIIETAKCLETWYGTDPETGAGTKTISK